MDYIIKIEDMIVWWSEEVYKHFTINKRQVLFKGTTQQCQKWIDNYKKQKL